MLRDAIKLFIEFLQLFDKAGLGWLKEVLGYAAAGMALTIGWSVGGKILRLPLALIRGVVSVIKGTISIIKKIRARRTAFDPTAKPVPKPAPPPAPAKVPEKILAAAGAEPAPGAAEDGLAAENRHAAHLAARDHRQQAGIRTGEQKRVLREEFRRLMRVGRSGTDREELAGLLKGVEDFTAAAMEFTGHDWEKAASTLADTPAAARLRGQLLTLADIGRLAKTGQDVDELTRHSGPETEERILLTLAMTGHPLVIENVRTRGLLLRRNKTRGRLLQFLSARRADWRNGAVKPALLRNMPLDPNEHDHEYAFSAAKDGLHAHIARALKEKQAMAGDRPTPQTPIILRKKAAGADKGAVYEGPEALQGKRRIGNGVTPVRQGPGPLRRMALDAMYGHLPNPDVSP